MFHESTFAKALEVSKQGLNLQMGNSFSPWREHIEQDTLLLAKYWFNQGRPVPT